MLWCPMAGVITVSNKHSSSENEAVTKLLSGEGILFMDSQNFESLFLTQRKIMAKAIILCEIQ